MKKIISLILILSIASYFSWSFIKKQNKYLSRETFAQELNKRVFKSKIKKQPPEWMIEQIEDEFAPFTSKGITIKTVDETFLKIRKTFPHNEIIRYRIIANELYRYFHDEEIVPLKDSSLEKAVKTILHFEEIRDMDFIISHQDGIPTGGQPKDFYVTEKKEMQAPLLCSAKKKDLPLVVLIPDWRSASKWWSKEIKSVLKGIDENSWDSKKNYGFWRGSSTNGIRPKLCRMALKYPNHLYAKINAPVDEELQKQFEEEGIYCNKGWVFWEKLLENKYLPLMDGVMSAAPAYQSRLLSNSLTLKQDFPGVQWFFKPLKPYVHYVPLKNDISDLIEKLEWAKKNDSLCKQISENATNFALNNLMFEDVYLYFYLVLKKYSSLSLINREEIIKEIENDSNWINIHSKEKLKKRLLKKSSKAFCNYAAPGF